MAEKGLSLGNFGLGLVQMHDACGELHIWGDESRQLDLELAEYPLPVCFGILQGMELFAENLPESRRGFPDETLSFAERTGRKIFQCTSTYGKRHYDLAVDVGGGSRIEIPSGIAPGTEGQFTGVPGSVLPGLEG